MTLRSAFFVLGPALLLGASANAAGISICDSLPINLIQNCGFEKPYPGGVGTVPTDWTGSDFTGFETVVTNPSQVNSGNQAMQIGNFKSQGAAVLSQSFADVSGTSYTFDFYLMNSAPNGANEQFQAFWGPSSNPTGGSPLFTDTGASGAYTLHTFTVTGTGSDTITFTAYNDPAEYYLDDVSVVGQALGSVPEPGTMALLAIAVCGIGLLKRRNA